MSIGIMASMLIPQRGKVRQNAAKWDMPTRLKSAQIEVSLDGTVEPDSVVLPLPLHVPIRTIKPPSPVARFNNS